MTNFPDVNPTEFDYRRLLDLEVLSVWTTKLQQSHASDSHVYETALATFQTALRSQVVEGDGRLSAGRRARKVEKHLRALVRASRKAERAAESLRVGYADHVREVQALPGKRQAKQLRSAGRRDQLTALTAKSLHKSASAFTPGSEETAAPAADTGRPAARGITDLFDQQQRRGA
ncbi:hypothetical protein [Streptomyces sp. NPDC006147]|uniref:hypothetical protein n=1 Tax=Streptomyces sp. NPDC006147 TaxID=3155597 RepID=UPI0033BC5B43